MAIVSTLIRQVVPSSKYIYNLTSFHHPLPAPWSRSPSTLVCFSAEASRLFTQFSPLTLQSLLNKLSDYMIPLATPSSVFPLHRVKSQDLTDLLFPTPSCSISTFCSSPLCWLCSGQISLWVPELTGHGAFELAGEVAPSLSYLHPPCINFKSFLKSHLLGEALPRIPNTPLSPHSVVLCSA